MIELLSTEIVDLESEMFHGCFEIPNPNLTTVAREWLDQ
jgi:hypothetical protein